MSDGSMNESRFNMWRAVFAMAHVDGTVTPEEASFAQNYLELIQQQADKILDEPMEVKLCDKKEKPQPTNGAARQMSMRFTNEPPLRRPAS